MKLPLIILLFIATPATIAQANVHIGALGWDAQWPGRWAEPNYTEPYRTAASTSNCGRDTLPSPARRYKWRPPPG